ncbi:MAG: GspH/FimT family pseudopilin [Candidatus Zixiibacteriota bacterium]
MKSISNDRGITLVELMVIVVIIGIVSAMAFPNFSQAINRLRFKGAARDIVSTMRLARSNAITQKQPYGVYFDQDDMTVTSFLDLVNPAGGSFESGDSVLAVDSLPDDFVALGTSFGGAIVYNPNGTASSTGSVNFVSHPSDGGVNICSVSVLASTGRTKMGDIYNY